MHTRLLARVVLLFSLMWGGLTHASDPDTYTLKTNDHIKHSVLLSKDVQDLWQQIKPVYEGLAKLASDSYLRVESHFRLATLGIDFCQQLASLDVAQPTVQVRIKLDPASKLVRLDELQHLSASGVVSNLSIFLQDIVTQTVLKIQEHHHKIANTVFKDVVDDMGQKTDDLLTFRGLIQDNGFHETIVSYQKFINMDVEMDLLCTSRSLLDISKKVLKVNRNFREGLAEYAKELYTKSLMLYMFDKSEAQTLDAGAESLMQVNLAAQELLQYHVTTEFYRAALYAHAAQQSGFTWPYPVFKLFGLSVTAPVSMPAPLSMGPTPSASKNSKPETVPPFKTVKKESTPLAPNVSKVDEPLAAVVPHRLFIHPRQVDGTYHGTVVDLNNMPLLLRLLPGEKQIVLTTTDALKLGITIGQQDTQIMSESLNKVFYAATHTLDTLSFAGKTFYNQRVRVTSDKVIPSYIGLGFTEQLRHDIDVDDQSLHVWHD